MRELAHGSIVWKALAASSAVVATLVATRWPTRSGKPRVRDDIDPADPSPILQAVAYAALTGLIAAAIKTYDPQGRRVLRKFRRPPPQGPRDLSLGHRLAWPPRPAAGTSTRHLAT